MWKRLFLCSSSLLTSSLALCIPSKSPGTTSYPANNPIEDRHSWKNFPSIRARCGAVFDGHGGWQVSDYLNLNVMSRLESLLSSSSALSRESAKSLLEKLFDSLEDEIFEASRATYKLGYANVSSVGACATVALTFDNWYVVANAGDCQAVLVNVNGSSVKGTNICEVHSSNLESEQVKLRNEHPNEKDIVLCKKPTACYVKGRLMPTRSFGDFHLKHEEFNNPRELGILHGFRKSRIKTFTGPYITHKPDVQSRDICDGDKFLILATDGLWDEMNEQEAAEIIADVENPQDAADLLLQVALERAAKSSRMDVGQLGRLEPGKRRSYHDDISVVVLPLR